MAQGRKQIGPCAFEGCSDPPCAKGYCRKHYYRLWRYGDPAINHRPGGRVCSIEGCERPYHANGYCAAHARAARRYGDPLVNRTPVAQPGRYRPATDHEHPLAGANGFVFEHRRVAYAKYGPGPQACHWCGKRVYWTREDGEPILHVDHVNDVKDDNRPENLVTACAGCNGSRGKLESAHGTQQVLHI
jgi:hypothetical protein